MKPSRPGAEGTLPASPTVDEHRRQISATEGRMLGFSTAPCADHLVEADAGHRPPDRRRPVAALGVDAPPRADRRPHRGAVVVEHPTAHSRWSRAVHTQIFRESGPIHPCVRLVEDEPIRDADLGPNVGRLGIEHIPPLNRPARPATWCRPEPPGGTVTARRSTGCRSTGSTAAIGDDLRGPVETHELVLGCDDELAGVYRQANEPVAG